MEKKETRAQKLRREYLENPTRKNRDRLVELYQPMVAGIAASVAPALSNMVRVDDLVSMGTVRLLETLNRYDCLGGRWSDREFRNYLTIRIRGSMFDGAADYGPSGRRGAKLARRAERATIAFYAQHGRDPGPGELAGLIGVTSRAVRSEQNIRAIRSGAPLWDQGEDPDARADFIEPIGRHKPFEMVGSRDAFRRLTRTMTRAQRSAIWLHYVEGLSLADTARACGYSVSNITHLIRGVMPALRDRLSREPELLQPA